MVTASWCADEAAGEEAGGVANLTYMHGEVGKCVQLFSRSLRLLVFSGRAGQGFGLVFKSEHRCGIVAE